jgi:hypothetical protein
LIDNKPGRDCYNSRRNRSEGEYMFNTKNRLSKLIRNDELIRENTNRVSDLSEDFVIFFGVQNKSLELSPYQAKLIDERRISLRQTIGVLRDCLCDHYGTVEKVMQSALGDSLMKVVLITHREMLNKLVEIDGLLLNLTPAGILLNGPHLKQKIEALCHAIDSHSEVDDSLLELIEIYST